MDVKTNRTNNTARLKMYISATRKIQMEEHWDHRFEGMMYSEPVTTKLGNCAVIFDFGSNSDYLSYAWECFLDALKNSQDLRAAKLDIYGWTDTIALLLNKQNIRMLQTNNFFNLKDSHQISFNTLVIKCEELKKKKYEILFVLTEFGMDSNYNTQDARSYYQLSDTMIWVLPVSRQQGIADVRNRLRIKKYILLD